MSRLVALKLRRLARRNARRRARNPIAQLIDQLERDLYGPIVKVRVMTIEEIDAKYGPLKVVTDPEAPADKVYFINPAMVIHPDVARWDDLCTINHNTSTATSCNGLPRTECPQYTPTDKGTSCQ